MIIILRNHCKWILLLLDVSLHFSPFPPTLCSKICLLLLQCLSRNGNLSHRIHGIQNSSYITQHTPNVTELEESSVEHTHEVETNASEINGMKPHEGENSLDVQSALAVSSPCCKTASDDI